MTQAFFAQIQSGGSPTTYIALFSVLVAVVMLTLWRESITTSSAGFFERTLATLAFITSRIAVVVFTGAMVNEHAGAPFLFVLMNLVCLYLAAECLPRGLDAERARNRESDEAEAQVEGEETPAPRTRYDEWRSARYQTLVFGLIGGLAYAIVPQASGVKFTWLGVLAAIALGATVRVSGALFLVARYAGKEVRSALFVLTSALTASWLFVVAAGATSGSSAAMLIKAAQVTDILALVAGLLSLQTNYIVLGSRLRHKVQDTGREAEQARAELTLLNRVASDMYEDSSSMIRRQHDHSPELRVVPGRGGRWGGRWRIWNGCSQSGSESSNTRM